MWLDLTTGGWQPPTPTPPTLPTAINTRDRAAFASLFYLWPDAIEGLCRVSVDASPIGRLLVWFIIFFSTLSAPCPCLMRSNCSIPPPLLRLAHCSPLLLRTLILVSLAARRMEAGFYSGSAGFIGSYRVLPGLTGSYRVLPSITGFRTDGPRAVRVDPWRPSLYRLLSASDRISECFTEFYRVLPSFLEFEQVFVGFT